MMAKLMVTLNTVVYLPNHLMEGHQDISKLEEMLKQAVSARLDVKSTNLNIQKSDMTQEPTTIESVQVRLLNSPNNWWPFKDGDQVKVVRCAVIEYINRIGTIKEVQYGRTCVSYVVVFDEGDSCSFLDFDNRPPSVELVG